MAYSDQLKFNLPDFARLSWVSAHHKEQWEPRILGIRHALQKTRLLAVAGRLCECAVVTEFVDELPWLANRVSELGLYSHMLANASGNYTPQHIHGSVARFAVARTKMRLAECLEAWRTLHIERLRVLLGIPACCEPSMNQDENSFWCVATKSTAPGFLTQELSVCSEPELNISWAPLGLQAILHCPCSFSCRPSMDLARSLRALANAAGYREETSWLREWLANPVEWSALHGIAEAKSLNAKMISATTATATKYTVRWRTSDVTADTQGRAIAHLMRRGGTSVSAAYARGIANPSVPDGGLPGWYYRDNGFSSLAAMSVNQAPVVYAATQRLAESPGDVLDLSCGNGALVQKIGLSVRGVRPCGMDTAQEAIEHARVLMPERAADFVLATPLALSSVFQGRTFALVLLRANRLMGMPRKAAHELLRLLWAQADQILAHVYPGSQSSSIHTLLAEFGLSGEKAFGSTLILLSRHHG